MFPWCCFRPSGQAAASAQLTKSRAGSPDHGFRHLTPVSDADVVTRCDLLGRYELPNTLLFRRGEERVVDLLLPHSAPAIVTFRLAGLARGRCKALGLGLV